MQQQETGKAGYIFMGLLIASFCILIIVFAWQTFLLVNTLFPDDNVFMKWVTVFSFDGCCLIYAGLELFYPFKWHKAKALVGIMWGATFFGSLLCTIAYMNLSSDHLLHQIIDSTVLIACYAVVTLVFSGDIVAITYLIKGEYTAHMAWKYGRRQRHEVDAAIANGELLDTRGMKLPPLSPPSSLAQQTSIPEFGTDEFKAWWIQYTGANNPWKEGEDSSPLARKASLHQNGHVTPE